MTKKILSLLLVLTVVLSCGTMYAFAADSLRFGTDWTYSRVVFTNSTPEEITTLETGNITATIKVKGSVAPQFFAVLLYEGEKMIDAAVDASPSGAIATGLTFDATINVTNASTQKIVTVLWDSATAMKPVCPAALSASTTGLKALYVDGEEIKLEDGVYSYTIDIKDPFSSVHPKIGYEVYDNSTKVEIIEGTAFPATSGATVPTTVKVTPFGGSTVTYTVNHKYDATPKKINPDKEFLYFSADETRWAYQGAEPTPVYICSDNLFGPVGVGGLFNGSSSEVTVSGAPVNVTLQITGDVNQKAFVVVRPKTGTNGINNKVIVNPDGTLITETVDYAGSYKSGSLDSDGNVSYVYYQQSSSKPVSLTPTGGAEITLPVRYELNGSDEPGDTGAPIYNRTPKNLGVHLGLDNDTIHNAEFIPMDFEGSTSGVTISFYVGQSAIIDIYSKGNKYTTNDPCITPEKVVVKADGVVIPSVSKVETEKALQTGKTLFNKSKFTSDYSLYWDIMLAYFDYKGYIPNVHYYIDSNNNLSVYGYAGRTDLLINANSGYGALTDSELHVRYNTWTYMTLLKGQFETRPVFDANYDYLAKIVRPKEDPRFWVDGIIGGTLKTREQMVELFDPTYIWPSEAAVNPSTKVWTLNDYEDVSTSISVPASTTSTTQDSTVECSTAENALTGNVDITVSGKVKNSAEGDMVTIELLQTGKASNAITAAYTSASTLKADIAAIKQVYAGADGTINEVISVPSSNTGFYQLRINGEDIKKISVITELGVRGIFDAIKLNCPSATDTAVSYLKTNFDLTNTSENIWLDAFNITEPLVTDARVSQDEMFKLFISLIPEIRTDSNYKTDLKDKLEFAAIAIALDKGLFDVNDIIVDKAVDAGNKFAVETAYIKAYDDADFTVNASKNASFSAENFTGKKYYTADKITSAYKDAVIFAIIKGLDYNTKVQKFIENYGTLVGVDIATYNTLSTTSKGSLWNTAAAFEGITTASAYVSAVNAEITRLASAVGTVGGTDGGFSGGSSGGSSGGGFSGGGGAPGGGTTITPGVIPSNTISPTGGAVFGDLTGYDWAKASIEALAKKGIVSGTGNGNFEPERNVTREEMLVMILRAYGIEIGNAVSDFSDAQSDGWYTSYLATAKNLGYVSGKPDGTFGVGEAVTREDAAVMAYNIAKAKGIAFDTETKTTFADNAEVSGYANDAINALKNANVINGKGEGLFAPKTNCTRAEAAKIIYTLITR